MNPDATALYLPDERKDIVNGTGSGYLISYAMDTATGALSRKSTVSTVGANPSYVSTDPSGAFVFTANHGNTYHAAAHITWDERTQTARQELLYDDGTVTVLSVQADQHADRCAHVAVLPAYTGPDRRHQRSSHPHAALPDPTGTFLVVCDKGSDRVHSYRIDRDTGRLRLADPFRSRGSVAPRHPLFHPGNGLLYLVNELDSSIDVLDLDGADGTLRHRRTVSTVPHDEPGDNHPADLALHPSGAYLFAANRGHDSICMLAIDPSSGLHDPLHTVPVGGSRPRSLVVSPDGATVYASCTDSNLITATAVDPATGRRTPTHTAVSVPRPTCVRFLPTPQFLRTPAVEGAPR